MIKLTDDHPKNPLSTLYRLKVDILPNPNSTVPEKIPISERVKPQIIEVTREGRVIVRFRPYFKSTELPLQLSNKTV